MARLNIDKAVIRTKLAPRREPYWGAPVARGLFVGFRKLGGEGGNWIARWRDYDGRQRYRSLGAASVALDYQAARVEAQRWMKRAAAGEETTEDRTVADACREYAEERKAAKGEATAHDADMRFKRTVYQHAIGKAKLSRIRQRDLETWRDDLTRPKPAGGDLSKAGANRTLSTLKAALNYALKRRYVGAERSVEWREVKAFAKASKRRELFLDITQRRALLNAAKGGARDLIEGAMLTGSRAGELTSALRSQFDERTGTLTLRGKTGERKVPVSPAALLLFKRLAKSKLPSAPLFTRDDGRPWAHSDWDELVREAAKAAKLPRGVCLYTLRHSFITAAIQGGMTPLEVARLTGTSLTMVDHHYGHLAPTAARERLALVAFV